MRRSALVLAPVVLSVLATFACEDSGSGSFGSIDLDAGSIVTPTPIPTPIADAAVVDAASHTTLSDARAPSSLRSVQKMLRTVDQIDFPTLIAAFSYE